MIEHVVITGDVTRPPECSDQTANITWLYHLVSEQIALVTGVRPVRLVGRGDEPGRNLITFDHWVSANAGEDVATWHFQQDKARHWSPDNTVFVCFECPENLRRTLVSGGFLLVDLNIHPIRFADDLLFGITGSEGLLDRVAPHLVDQRSFLLNAQFTKAKIQRGVGFPPLPECGIIVGQVPRDRSLIRRGRVVTYEDYLEEIRAFQAAMGVAYFKPHPYAPAPPACVEAMGIEIVTHNIYQLLCHERVRAVSGISSSVLYEAPYFGVNALPFEPLPHPREAVLIDDLTSTEFWRRALTVRDKGFTADRQRGCEIRVARVPNRARNLLNERWAFE